MASSSSGASAVGDGDTHEKDEEPVVESLDQIMVEREWSRLIVHGRQPSPRSKHAAVAVGRKMFVMGGTSPEGTQNDVQMFHAENLTWESLSCQSFSPNLKPQKGVQHDKQCPSCVCHSPVLWQKQFVLVGCQAQSKVVTVLSLDLGSGSWCTLTPTGNAPVARTGHTVVRMAYRLVLFGGEDIKGRPLNDIHVLDLWSLLWLPVETSGLKPSPRTGHCAASYCGRYLWIYGGKKGSTYYNDTYCLDFLTMEWSKGRTKGLRPPARAGHSGIVDGNKWYIIGGEHRKRELRKMVAFNLDTQEWSEVANLRSGSPLAKDGISLVRIQSKGRTFAVAFGGHDANLSNQIYVMLLPSKSELGSPELCSQSGSFSSAHSQVSRRTSIASSADIADAGGTPDSTFSIKLSDMESEASGFGDQEAEVPGNKESILDSQDPSTTTTANDDEAPYQRHEPSHDERQRLAEEIQSVPGGDKLQSQASNFGDLNIEGSDDIKPTSRDLNANPQNGTHEPAVNSDLNQRLLAALKLNGDLQKQLLQNHFAKVELENLLNEISTEKDDLEKQVLDLLNSKADEEWKLEESQRKLEEMERKLNSSSQGREDADAGFKSTSREKVSVARSSSLATKLREDRNFSEDTSARSSSRGTKLFEDSAFSTETCTSNETERRLEEAEIQLAALVKSHHLVESKLITATREKRELSEREALAMQRMEEARSDCKALRAQNLRLEHDLLAVKALLKETNEELESKQVELAQATGRNIELQVEMHELSQRFSGS